MSFTIQDMMLTAETRYEDDYVKALIALFDKRN